MCQRLHGTETGLVGYWKSDEGSGTSTLDATAAHLSGTLHNVSIADWKISGAAIGDTSVFLRGSALSSSSLSLASSSKGTLTADHISANTWDLHLYRVDTLPLYTDGLGSLAANNTYWGAFPSNDSGSTSMDLHFDYNTYPYALANESSLNLYNRDNASQRPWSNFSATLNTTSNVLDKTLVTSRKEIMLADFTAPACTAPTALNATLITAGSAQLSWTGSASHFNIAWGRTGTSLSSCSYIYNVLSSPYTKTGLAPSTNYDFYVQDSCGAGLVSSWAGPFHFRTLDLCSTPSGLHIDSVGPTSLLISWTAGSASQWVLEWGPAGFTPGVGIPYTVSSNPYLLTGLAPHTAYDIYLRAKCDTVNSAQIGPQRATTDSMRNVGIQGPATHFDAAILLPNPVDQWMFVQNVYATNESQLHVSIFDESGKAIVGKVNFRLMGNQLCFTIDNSLSPAYYWLRYQDEAGPHQLKFLKQ